jgi:hypothetical protein
VLYPLQKPLSPLCALDAGDVYDKPLRVYALLLLGQLWNFNSYYRNS